MNAWRQIKTVFAFTLRDAVRKKAFLISNILIMLVITVLCLIPRLTGGSASQDPTQPAENTQSGVCYVVDQSSALPGARDALQSVFPSMAVLDGTPSLMEDYRQKVKEDGGVAIVLIGTEAVPSVTVISKDFMSLFPADVIGQVLNQVYRLNALHELGYGDDAAAAAMTSLPLATETAGTLNLTNYLLGILLMVLVFFVVYYYGYGVAMSVATEKTSRVMETLIVSAKPSRILLGKCLAMGTAGLLQFVGIMLYSWLCTHFLFPQGVSVFGESLDFSVFTLGKLALVMVYFLLGYAIYAMLNSVCGAMVSRIEDLQSAMMPTMLVAMVSFYTGYISNLVPGTGAAVRRIAALVPFSAPFTVPYQLLNGDLSTGDILLSILFLLLGIAAVAFLSIRVYAASVLHYGSRLKWKDLAGMAKIKTE
ncbi:MAG: ABC transporter permease [Oscillospiraceae bacterium]|jgi:ABC-2 type transport system permease protein|nr:ABC transporter permease [Oscillospiraceae bacterium]